jgi:hypothetical protein
MSIENVSVVVNIKTLKGRFIEHKFSQCDWVDSGGGEECGKEEECYCQPVCSLSIRQKRIDGLKNLR